MDAIAEVLATVTSLAGATKAVSETFSVLKTKVKGNREVEQAVSGALAQVASLHAGMLNLQEKVLHLQQELAAAQSENIKLREEVSREKSRTADLGQLERKKIGDSVVMVREEEPDTYYCPTCYGEGKIIPIQPLPQSFQKHFGSHRCAKCKSLFQLG